MLKEMGNGILADCEDPTRNHHRMPWNAREFIAWDGEGTEQQIRRVPTEFVQHWIEEYFALHGTLPDKVRERYDLETEEIEPQPYVLLANSKDDYIVNREGIPTTSCFEFILETKRRFPNSTFVGFGFTYDSAQILRDLPWSKLVQLWESNRCRYQRYGIEYFPRKWLRINHKETGRTATIYDVLGFFQSSFLTACEKYLGKDDPSLKIIREGKAARNTFSLDELDEFIIPYNRMELRLLVRLMDILREDLHETGLDLTRWYGPGAVANQVLRKHHVDRYMSKEVPQEVSSAAQYAYAGGRFEHFQLGHYTGPVYEYDIRSAYPAAAYGLPDLSKGTWEYTESFEYGSFGIWHIDYDGKADENGPQPLFCRAKDGRISFPTKVSGWYWSPEASLVPDSVQYGYVWRTTSEIRPFRFIPSMYEERRQLKEAGISSERALKLALNSIYGKLAQITGGKNKAPKWHQLEWAGYITSYTRAKLFNAMMAKPWAIIAAETDAIFSTEPLMLPIGDGLGEWELTTFTEILYLQSGFYYAKTEDEKTVCRYRGLDRDRATSEPVGLPFGRVLDHLRDRGRSDDWRTKSLHSTATRFINIGLALHTSAKYRTWETSAKTISVDQGRGKSKRYHLNCSCCQEGLTLADCLHPMEIGGYRGPSNPHPLPWAMGRCDDEYENYLLQEAFDKWQ